MMPDNIEVGREFLQSFDEGVTHNNSQIQINQSRESIGNGRAGALEISDWKGFRDSTGEISLEQ
jgi:hypothetical protein